MTPKEETAFFQVHSGLPREGPGSRHSTQQAFACLPGLPPEARILDIGCGPGAQTLQLAELHEGEIYAVDNHPPFIERLRNSVRQKRLDHRVFPLVGDMQQLPFDNGFFDLIWAEGAIYIIGVERGLAQWRVVLRDQGFVAFFVAFTEVTWLRDDPPGELKDFWKQAYPAISSRPQNERTIQRAGYRLLHHFTLPQSDWWDEYYGPIEKKLPALRRTCEDDPEALRVLETEEEEIRLYRRYARYYGYVFYIAQKADG